MLVHMGSIIICVLQISYLNNGYKKTILSLSLTSDDAKNNLKTVAKPTIFRSHNRVSASISEALTVPLVLQLRKFIAVRDLTLFFFSSRESNFPCFSVPGFDATHPRYVGNTLQYFSRAYH